MHAGLCDEHDANVIDDKWLSRGTDMTLRDRRAFRHESRDIRRATAAIQPDCANVSALVYDGSVNTFILQFCARFRV